MKTISVLVDLRGELSNPSPALSRMLKGSTSPYVQDTRYPSPQRAQQKQIRLSAEQQRELVDCYREGALQRELATSYGIERRTVGVIIKRHGATQRRGLTDRQIDEAVTAYAGGQSLAKIAEQHRVTARTVRTRLLERGLVMRDTQGRSHA